jgi:MerR family transcriptional regulator, redox-sensitive transcriptional activator SoxR
MALRSSDTIGIGELSTRTGVAASALRFYESVGLLTSGRTGAGHRVYPRHTLRRVAFIRVAQRVGLSLDDIDQALASLPRDRAPTRREWGRMSRRWQRTLDDRIRTLERLRDDLTGCIGCGCLSLGRCRLYNPQDAAAGLGDGPRFLLGDDPDQFVASRRGRLRKAAPPSARAWPRPGFEVPPPGRPAPPSTPTGAP